MTPDEETDGFEVDAKAMDILAALFERCGDLGIEIPAEMPLEDPEHQRAAVHYVAKLIADKVTGMGREL